MAGRMIVGSISSLLGLQLQLPHRTKVMALLISMECQDLVAYLKILRRLAANPTVLTLHSAEIQELLEIDLAISQCPYYGITVL